MDLHTKLTQFITRDLVGKHDLNLTGDDDLLLSGLVDSLGVVRLITFIEQELHIEVPPSDVTIENFATVNAIAVYLETKQGV